MFGSSELLKHISVCMFPALMDLNISMLLYIVLLSCQQTQIVRLESVVNLHSFIKMHYGHDSFCMETDAPVLR